MIYPLDDKATGNDWGSGHEMFPLEDFSAFFNNIINTVITFFKENPLVLVVLVVLLIGSIILKIINKKKIEKTITKFNYKTMDEKQKKLEKADKKREKNRKY